MKWHLAFNTDDKDRNGIYEEGKEPCLEQQKQFLVPARTIVVFIGLKDPETEKNGKKGSGKKSPKKTEKKAGKEGGEERRQKS